MTPAAYTEHETVDAYLARGGRITTLIPCAANRPLVEFNVHGFLRDVERVLPDTPPKLPWPDKEGHKAFLEALERC